MTTTMTKRAQGTFCWPELGTTDQAKAKAFYTGLFGWTVEATPLPAEMGGGEYLQFGLGGRAVAACYTLMPEMVTNGVPPHWGAYIAVDDCDAIAKKAKELGATVLVEPMTVMDDLGRMAAFQDPTGAAFSVWQAGTHIGAQVLDEHGALCWTELVTGDVAKAKAFYTTLIGYTTEAMPMGDAGEYTLFKDPADTTSRAGMMAIGPDMKGIPPHWATYFQTDDIRASVADARRLGARVHMDVTPIPHVGEFAVLEDPVGAMFCLLQMAPRP